MLEAELEAGALFLDGALWFSHGGENLPHTPGAPNPPMPPSTSLHIERHAPVSLRLFRSSRFLALSRREREVCQLILAGHSNTEIAHQLGIKPASVIAYTKSLYRRLNIHGRKELLPALIGTHPHN